MPAMEAGTGYLLSGSSKCRRVGVREGEEDVCVRWDVEEEGRRDRAHLEV